MNHDLMLFTNWLADVVVVAGGIPWAVLGWIVLFGLAKAILAVVRS